MGNQASIDCDESLSRRNRIAKSRNIYMLFSFFTAFIIPVWLPLQTPLDKGLNDFLYS